MLLGSSPAFREIVGGLLMVTCNFNEKKPSKKKPFLFRYYIPLDEKKKAFLGDRGDQTPQAPVARGSPTVVA